LTAAVGASQPLLAREGWGHILVSTLLAVVVTWLWGFAWASPLWLIWLFVVQFFRDPSRQIPDTPGVVCSPADGKLIVLGVTEDPYLHRPALRMSVFMNVFSVHSNRAPTAGVVKNLWYQQGRFFNAALDKAALENERNALHLVTEDGHDVTFVQIAGLIARRILCYVEPGATLQRGQRYGFIRFGSRVDLYLPPDSKPKVRLGQNVTAGETVLASLPDNNIQNPS